MSRTYTYAADDSVLQVFAQSNPRDRLDLLNVFQHLAACPSLPGDYLRKTPSLRDIRVNRFGK